MVHPENAQVKVYTELNGKVILLHWCAGGGRDLFTANGQVRLN
jgi:hypothetical protein